VIEADAAAAVFRRRDGQLCAERMKLAEIAERYGTPCYVYSRAALEHGFLAFERAFADRDHLICYAVKANGNLAVLGVLAALGAGFDIVSGGELERVLAAGGEPSRILFSGVGKSEAEMVRALGAGIGSFNVESALELERLDALAGRVGRRAPVSIRVNPDVDPRTHPYIATGLKSNKFGVPMSEAQALYRRAAEMANIDLRGLDCHIGSQLTAVEPYLDALERLLLLLDRLAAEGIALEHLNLGGGLGIRYRDEAPPTPPALVTALRERVGDRPLKLLIEPGRAIVGPAGVLLTRVEYLKHGEAKNFAVVDAGMNDFLRPALYGGWHEIVPVAAREQPARLYDVVGPVCESADFLGSERRLSLAVGDLLAVRDAGAYGFVMSSNYNARPRAAEILVDGESAHLVRRRETLQSLFAGEALLPDTGRGGGAATI